jgi:hypothetical protein
VSVPYNRPGLAEGLTRFLGVKGGFTSEYEGVLSPVLVAATLHNSPYLRDRVAVGGSGTSPAVVAAQSYFGVRPGPNVVFQAKRFSIRGVAAARVLSAQVLSAADILTLTAPAALSKLLDLSTDDRSKAFTSSDMWSGSAAGGIGGRISAFDQLAGTQYDLEFPEPGVFLFGNDPSGRPGLFIENNNLNEAVLATVYGYEWPLPG